jgi:predicted patatin/cPLA2 family phospholipase
MHNLLSLDGGGTRGVFSIQILKRMEELLREKHNGREDFVLADHFDYIGGTSTGAIIAALLSWGASMKTVEDFYLDQSKKVFGHKTWMKVFRYKFHAYELEKLLRKQFCEDNNEAATLGTKKLRTLFLCVMRNATTGAPWIITNSRHAKYNQEHLDDNNLNIPLYQLIRASTAAPVFFEPQEIDGGAGKNWMFIDGAITPYNNPAFIMFMTATQACFGNNWPDGTEQMRIISVGTGRRRVRFTKLRSADINVADQVKHALLAMIDSNNQQQDWMCRTFGHCLWGEAIDSEVGDLIPEQISSPSQKRFLYCRYNHNLTADEIAAASHIPDFYNVDSLKGIPFWKELGQSFARQCVKIEHLA